MMRMETKVLPMKFLIIEVRKGDSKDTDNKIKEEYFPIYGTLVTLVAVIIFLSVNVQRKRMILVLKDA